MKQWEYEVAACLFAVHSRLCAWRLLSLWRARELIDETELR